MSGQSPSIRLAQIRHERQLHRRVRMQCEARSQEVIGKLLGNGNDVKREIQFNCYGVGY